MSFTGFRSYFCDEQRSHCQLWAINVCRLIEANVTSLIINSGKGVVSIKVYTLYEPWKHLKTSAMQQSRCVNGIASDNVLCRFLMLICV